MTMAERMTKRRAETGLSLRDVRDQTGFSVSAIEQWEKGFRKPSPEFAERLAAYLEADVDEIREQILRDRGYIAHDQQVVRITEPPAPKRTGRRSVPGVKAAPRRPAKRLSSSYQYPSNEAFAA